jgi:3-dehydroquinate synthase
MDFLQQSFQVHFTYPVYFTENLFYSSNIIFRQFMESQYFGTPKRILFLIDDEVVKYHPELPTQISEYVSALNGYTLTNIMVVPGGEKCKNETVHFDKIIEAVNHQGIDRHSYLIAIGGGSLLDLAGYAAAVSHRGIRHIRIPTTVLAQNDSGIGVKNSVNYKGKKNFLGTFAPPAAVFNDCIFLTSLNERDWRSGISEAIKVALIKDKIFFEWIEANSTALANRDMDAMKYLIKHCASLHMEHIRSGDPFELGSSRPLDFGHWSAHKLEQLTNFEIRHGEAVALGIALDSVYSFFSNQISETDAERIIHLLQQLGFATTHPLMMIENVESPILIGLDEFREHLGGQLTIMLLQAIGKGEEVHELDTNTLKNASDWLYNKSLITQAV